jgi:hypothetical protein
MRHTFFLLVAVMALSACEPKLNATQKLFSYKLDTLHYAADTMLTAMNTVNDSILRAQVDQIESIYKTVATANPDSADKRFWITEVNRLEFMYSSYSKFLRDAESIEKSLKESQNQVETLRNSIVDSKIDSAQAAQYLQDEALAMGQLQMQFNKRQPNAKRAIQMWDTTQTHFIDLAAQVKSRQP